MLIASLTGSRFYKGDWEGPIIPETVDNAGLKRLIRLIANKLNAKLAAQLTNYRQKDIEASPKTNLRKYSNYPPIGFD